METSDYNNETIETINKRHSTRKFVEKEVSREDIETILNAANKAPSAHNKQSWKFIVITGEKKKELADLVNTRIVDFPRPSSVLLRMAGRSISSAPAVIAVANTSELINHGTDLFNIDKSDAKDFFRTMEIQSSAAAVENLLLAANSIGLSTVWLGILILIKDDVLQLLGEPEGEFMAVIPVGYSANPGKSPKKVSLDTVVKYLD